MVSSRRQESVQQAVEELKEENINVAGIVCHVGKQEDCTQLIQEVNMYNYYSFTFCVGTILIFIAT